MSSYCKSESTLGTQSVVRDTDRKMVLSRTDPTSGDQAVNEGKGEAEAEEDHLANSSHTLHRTQLLHRTSLTTSTDGVSEDQRKSSSDTNSQAATSSQPLVPLRRESE